MDSVRRTSRELDLYSWTQTRVRSDLTLRVLLEKFGRAVDVTLHLVPALFAVVLILMAYQMAHGPRYATGSPRGANATISVSPASQGR